MTLQYVAKSISKFKPAKFIHVRTGAHISLNQLVTAYVSEGLGRHSAAP